MYKQEIKELKENGKVSNRSSLKDLNPFVRNDVTQSSGRLAKTPLSATVRIPVIMPGDHHVTKLIVTYLHHLSGNARYNADSFIGL